MAALIDPASSSAIDLTRPPPPDPDDAIDAAIPFNRADVVGRELELVHQAVAGGHTSAGGPFSRIVSDLLMAELGAEDVLLTTSCTSALELAAMMLDLGPDDTVIVPSFTFVTTAQAFTRDGARLLFADIEPTTLGLDPDHVASLVDDRTRAIVAVHYAGVGCDMAGLARAAGGRPDISIIEDNAHGLFGGIGGQPLGTFGRFAALSFHETKNIVCGEGGALVLNEARDVERANVVVDKGTNRGAFRRGEVDEYTWTDRGSSFGLSDLLAAYLLGQLEERDTIQAQRRAIHERYRDRLEPFAVERGFDVMGVPDDRQAAHHLFYVLLPDRATRDRVLASLRADGITAAFHYVPLHDSPMAGTYTDRPTACPVTSDISGRLLRLPLYHALPLQMVDHIADRFLAAV